MLGLAVNWESMIQQLKDIWNIEEIAKSEEMGSLWMVWVKNWTTVKLFHFLSRIFLWMIVTGNEKWVHGDNPKIIEPANSTVKPKRFRREKCYSSLFDKKSKPQCIMNCQMLVKHVIKSCPNVGYFFKKAILNKNKNDKIYKQTS